MKRCSQCNQTYTDDELNYCLSDGTPLVPAFNSTSEETVILPSSSFQQSVQSAQRGINPLFLYATIGILALVAGAMTIAWLKSGSNVSSNIGNESAAVVTNSIENKPNTEQRQNDEQKESLAKEQEQQKITDERKNLESKKIEPPAASPTVPSSTKSSGGTWYIVLGSFPKSERSKADERLQSVRSSGYDANIIDTNNYPGFRGGLWAVVAGPHSKSDAGRLLARIKSVRSDAYIKSGW